MSDGAGAWFLAYGVMVLALDGEHVAAIVGFADPSLHAAFGLPRELPSRERSTQP